ncbi:MAG: hypothetical protein QF380_06815 [Candidatus Marinimicrobia bacterium]|nr:hypothetical protein [Candidatus Neomarinimicrobiota bacterium]
MKRVINILNQILCGISLLSLGVFTVGICLGNQHIDLDEFDDLELKPLEKQRIHSNKNKDSGQKLILFDDNLYLLDDDFDFGEEEYELQKLELNPDDLETAKEYEAFLNAFFDNSLSVGSSLSNPSYSSDFQENKSRSRKDTFSDNRNQPDKREKTKVKSSRKGTGGSMPQFSPNRPKRGAMGFGVSSIIGATIPVTMNDFTASSNMGLRIDTPVSFNIAGLEAVTGIDGYMSSMSVNENLKYSMFNIIGNVSIFPLQSIETRVGLGLNSMTYDNKENGMHPSFSFDINYYLPMNISGFKFAVNLHGQRTFGYVGPGSGKGDSTDFIYFGLLIKTPLGF